MISPHAAARCRSLFTMSLDADRARRAAGLPEKAAWYQRGAAPPFPVPHRWLLKQELQANVRAVAQTIQFNGG